MEKGRLQYQVEMIAQSEGVGNFRSVNCIEGDTAVCNVPFGLGGQVLFQLLSVIRTVDQISSAGTDLLCNVVFVQIGRVVAGDEIRGFDVVGRADGPVGETQMASREAEGFFRIVLKISLRELFRVVVDDSDGIFVGAHRTVRAKAPEFAADGIALFRIKGFMHFEGCVGDIVDNADGEAVFGILLFQLLKNSKDLGRSGVLGGQAVSAADDSEIRAAAESRAYVGIERFARAAVLLGAVQYRDSPAALRDGGKEAGDVEGPVEMHLYETYLLALRVQIVHDLLGASGNRTHGDDHALRVRGSVVIKNMIFPAGDFREPVQIIFHNVGQGIIVCVAGFPDLEENIGILHRGAQHGVLGIQGLGPEGVQSLEIVEVSKILVIDLLHLVDLVGGAEAIKEV